VLTSRLNVVKELSVVLQIARKLQSDFVMKRIAKMHKHATRLKQNVVQRENIVENSSFQKIASPRQPNVVEERPLELALQNSPEDALTNGWEDIVKTMLSRPVTQTFHA
jgi:hypothetical protein